MVKEFLEAQCTTYLTLQLFKHFYFALIYTKQLQKLSE